MWSWRNKRALPIGIEIGTHSVRMLQMRAEGQGLVLQAASCADIPGGPQADETTWSAAVTMTLKNLMQAGDFVGRRCVTTMPVTEVHPKSLRLPQMPEADLSQAVQWEARERLGFDLTEGRLVYFRAGEVRRGTEVRDEILVFGATAEALRAHIRQISQAGLVIDAIDLHPTAMLRAVQRVHPSAGGISAIVDITATGTQLVICQEGRLVFYKNIDIGGAALDRAVAQKLGVPGSEAVQIRMGLGEPSTATDAATGSTAEGTSSHLEQAVVDAMRPTLEELGRELDMCIRYYVVTFRGTRPDVIRLTGDQAQAPRVADFLANMLGLRIEAAQPLRGVMNLNQITRPDRSANWTLATGLTLYGLENDATEAAA